MARKKSKKNCSQTNEVWVYDKEEVINGYRDVMCDIYQGLEKTR